MSVRILQGDCREVMRTLAENSVDVIGIEFDPAYIEIARRRIAADAPLFANVETEAA